MSLYNDYEQMCKETAIYPMEVEAPYLALGLCSEAAELEDVDDFGDYAKELGDCQWYMCRLANHYGFKWNDIVVSASVVARTYNNADLTFEAGMIAGYIKKALRDGSKWTGEEREDHRQKIYTRIHSCVNISISLASENGFTYDNILQANVDKLRSRQQRGTLQGSGDNR